MLSLLFIVSQAVLGVAGLVALWRLVLPELLLRVRQGEVFLDVWLPVALVLPLLVFVGDVGPSVRGAGWLVLGAPVAIGVLAGAAALLLGRVGLGTFGEEFAEGEAIRWRIAPRIVATAALAGIVLLLLGAAEIMSIWIGQCAFALAAILLWINTPEAPPRSVQSDPSEIRSGWGMILLLGAVIAMSGLTLLLMSRTPGTPGTPGPGTFHGIPLAAAVIAIAFSGVAVSLIAVRLSAGACMRVGLWAASFGVLAGLGLISLKHLIPRALAAVAEENTQHSPLVAYGFGAYAIEATVLVALPAIAVLSARVPSVGRKLLGGVLLLGAAFLVLCRLGLL